MANTNGVERFRLELPPPMERRIEQLHERAESEGRGAAFRRSLRRAINRLKSQAPHVGHPFRMTAAGFTVRHLTLAPVEVEFVVHRVRRVVWIWRIDLTP